MTPREVLALCREKDVKAVDLRFTDLFGKWQHLTIPVGRLDEGVFEDGVGLDGSRYRGWQTIHQGDLLALPQSDTAFVDPFGGVPTLALICDIQDPVTGEPYARDPRHIATKAANYLRRTGIADIAHFGAEPRFFVFDKARFNQSASEGYYHLLPSENQGAWPDCDSAEFGDSRRRQQGQGAAAPTDARNDLHDTMMQGMFDCGLRVESHLLELDRGGRCAIDLEHRPLVLTADWLQVYKHCVRQVSRLAGKTATFMPQPLVGYSGSGMHLHLSFWKDDEPLFAGNGYAGLSDIAMYAIGGILRHAPALLALTNPTTNSFKRLAQPDAPVRLSYSQSSRSAACRIPMYSQSPKSKRIEFRCPDPTCNPYLAFAAITLAAVDGIQRKLSPGKPLEHYLADPARFDELAGTPATLGDALTALQNDADFLLHDGVFTPDVLETWIHHKRQNEVDAMGLRPHPYEFCLYFDA
jgi:glutamine synthetase